MDIYFVLILVVEVSCQNIWFTSNLGVHGIFWNGTAVDSDSWFFSGAGPFTDVKGFDSDNVVFVEGGTIWNYQNKNYTTFDTSKISGITEIAIDKENYRFSFWGGVEDEEYFR